MNEEKQIRIDKYLWAVRVFKTRSMASNACKKDKVLIAGKPVKASRFIKIGERIDIKVPPIIKSYLITGYLEKRMGAKFVVNFVKDITPEEEILKFKIIQQDPFGKRPRGSGRPTKKERRIIDRTQHNE